MSRPLVWRQLAIRASVRPSEANDVLLAFATMTGHPLVILEAVAQEGVVTWRVGADAGVMPRIRAVLQAHLPDVRLLSVTSSFEAVDDVSLGGGLRIPRTRTEPLRRDAIDHVTRQLFTVFGGTVTGEMIRVQLLLGPRTRPRRGPAIDGITRTVVEARHGQYGFGCALRIAVRADHEKRARHLIAQTAAAFRSVEVPGIAIGLGGQSRRTIVDVRTPFVWPLWLAVEDLVSFMAWPTMLDPHVELPAMPPRHPRLMPATNAHPDHGRPFGLSASERLLGRDRLVAGRVDDALRHTHVLGLNGTGKSTLLAHLVLADITQGRGVVLIDPKGDLVDDVLARVPSHRRDDVVLLDARYADPVGINPLNGPDPDLAADSLLSIFHDLFKDAWGPRTGDILHASLLTLARRGDASLVMVPLLLANDGFRRSVTRRQAAADPLGLGTFWATFESWSEAERAQAIQPLMNKLRTVLLRPALRGMFGQRSPKFDVSDVFTRRRILLVSLGKGAIGIEGARLLGSIVTAQLWHAVLARTSTPPADRDPVMVHIDEVQDFIAGIGDLGDALATARGYGVGFTVAHQELGQLAAHRAAVLANARSRVVFQPAPSDARDLATQFGAGQLDREDFRALGAFQSYAQLLVDNSLAPWVSLVGQPLTFVREGRAGRLRADSARRYGRPLDEVERDLLSMLAPSAAAAPEAPQTAQDGPRAPGDGFGRRRPRTTPPGDGEAS